MAINVTERVRADTVEAAWCAAWRSLAYDPATQVHETPTALSIVTPDSPELLLNAILRFQPDRAVTERDLERLLRPYRLAGHPMQWWLRLDTAPQGLRGKLAALGMQPWDRPPGMILALHDWVPPATATYVQVQQASQPMLAEAALTIICEVFGTKPQPMRHWSSANPTFTLCLALVRDEPVGALAFQLIGETAGFFHVATLPQWRRRGVAWSLMTEALRSARAAGARFATLTSSIMAQAMYQGLGFIPCCQFEFWAPGPRLMGEFEEGGRIARG